MHAPQFDLPRSFSPSTARTPDPPAWQDKNVACGRLVPANQRMVASVALSATSDLQTSEGIAHDTVLTVWQGLSELGNPVA